MYDFFANYARDMIVRAVYAIFLYLCLGHHCLGHVSIFLLYMFGYLSLLWPCTQFFPAYVWNIIGWAMYAFFALYVRIFFIVWTMYDIFRYLC